MSWEASEDMDVKITKYINIINFYHVHVLWKIAQDPRVSLTPLHFFPSKSNKMVYGVKNSSILLYFSLHNVIYSINKVICFLFVHYSIMKWEMEYDWSIFTPHSILLHFREKNEVYIRNDLTSQFTSDIDKDNKRYENQP